MWKLIFYHCLILIEMDESKNIKKLKCKENNIVSPKNSFLPNNESVPKHTKTKSKSSCRTSAVDCFFPKENAHIEEDRTAHHPANSAKVKAHTAVLPSGYADH